jgi:hypothetical protein
LLLPVEAVAVEPSTLVVVVLEGTELKLELQ